MLSREEVRAVDDVIQELNGQVLEVQVVLEVLRMLGDPVPQHVQDPHGASGGDDGLLVPVPLAEGVLLGDGRTTVLPRARRQISRVAGSGGCDGERRRRA